MCVIFCTFGPSLSCTTCGSFSLLIYDFYFISNSLLLQLFSKPMAIASSKECYRFAGGHKRMTTSGSRAEFLAVDALGSTSDIKYDRTGGWFVSTRRALLLGLLAIASMVLVGVLVHYLDTCRGLRTVKLSRWL